MQKSVLVVGGAGYIGSHTAKLLLKKGYRPIILDDLSTGHREAAKRATQNGLFYEGSYDDQQLVSQILRDNQIDTVMHFGAKALVEESTRNPFLYYSANVGGTIALLEAMLDAQVKKFIFSSTCATFGQHDTAIGEECEQNPVNPYGRSKLFVEKILKDFETAYGLRSGILRYFNAAGADPDGELGEDHDPETHLIPNALKAILDPKFQLTVYGNDYPTPDGSCVRDYIHVNDLADAHIRTMEHISNHNQSLDLCLGTGHGASIFEILKTVAQITGRSVPHTIGPRRPGDPPHLVADSSKASKVLNWKNQLDLQAIVKTAFNWTKSRS